MQNEREGQCTALHLPEDTPILLRATYRNNVTCTIVAAPHEPDRVTKMLLAFNKMLKHRPAEIVLHVGEAEFDVLNVKEVRG